MHPCREDQGDGVSTTLRTRIRIHVASLSRLRKALDRSEISRKTFDEARKRSEDRLVNSINESKQ